MPIELGTLDQAHDGSGTLAGAQRARKQPIVSSNGNRTDLVLDPVVVDRQLPVIEEPRERPPAPEAVVQRFGSGRAVNDFLALQHHPLMHGIGQRFGCGLANLQPLISA